MKNKANGSNILTGKSKTKYILGDSMKLNDQFCDGKGEAQMRYQS